MKRPLSQKKTILLILEWCRRKYKKSKYFEEYPALTIRRTGCKYKGVFDDEELLIEIFPNNHKTLNDLVKTMIHEYQHYLQDPELYEHNSKASEDNANKIMRRDFKECLKDLKKWQKNYLPKK